MKRKLILVLLLTSIAFATQSVKIKVRQNDNLVKFKSKISIKKGSPKIAHILVNQGKNNILDLYLGKSFTFLSRLKFKYIKPNNKNILRYKVEYYNGNSYTKTIEIKNPIKIIEKNKENINSKFSKDIWNIKNKEKLEKTLFLNKKYIKEKLFSVNILPSEYFSSNEKSYIESTYSTYITIKTNLKLKTIYIISDTLEYPLISIINLQEDAIIDHSFSIDTGARCCKGTAEITLIGEDYEGVLYKDVSVPLTLACSTTDGNCY